ncbi:predicted protein [Nematostella vectensis]|uniref:Inositol-tetrakisphosphate 1-kinase n=1 Tax=Nematostella vectensis TaxID=45351 RepID=A7SIB4_NEMVE|nr:predicted protein [Nematostella vectensis]|eukprot:XP_001628629.1 predicted protein [Nematostella vectensis]
MSSSKNGLIVPATINKRVGFLLSPKKKRKTIFDAFAQLCGKTGIELVEIDLNVPLEEQGPFDIIIQKITDYMAEATEGDEASEKTVQSLKVYLQAHPQVKVLDPLDSVEKLCDRVISYKVMKQCEIQDNGWKAYIPNFVAIDSLDQKENLRRIKEANVEFPMVCKSVIGHGSEVSHQMALIFNQEGLQDLNPPCVVQQFINHNAVLYKIFVAAHKYCTVVRPSIKNFYRNLDLKKTIFFNSHDVSKSDSDSHLSVLDKFDEDEDPTPTDNILVGKLVKRLRDKLNLTMFGIDIVVEKGTKNHVVIDINYFPGYEGMPSFPKDMLQYIHLLLGEGEEEVGLLDIGPPTIPVIS